MLRVLLHFVFFIPIIVQVKRLVNDLLDFTVVFVVGSIIVLNNDGPFIVDVGMLASLDLVLRDYGHVVLANNAEREVVLDWLQN